MATIIKIVKGNVLRLRIPLQIKIRSVKDGKVVENIEDFYPSSDYPVIVSFSHEYGYYDMDCSVDGNVVMVEDKGTLTAKRYAIEVLCRDDNGLPYRFAAPNVVDVVNYTKDADVPSDVEYEVETHTLEGAVFVSYGVEQVQADWTEADIHSKAYIKNKPTNIVEDESYVHTDNNYTDLEKEKLADLGNYDDSGIRQELGGKVDKVAGKGLSTNDFTDEDKSKLNSALQSETDPTVPSWAKQPNKPSYTAQEVGALPNSTKYGSNIDLAMDSATYVLTLSLKDQDGTVLNTKTVDLPIESVVVNGRYDAANKKIVLTLQSGSTIDVPVGDLIAGLQTEITNVNMLDADLVDDTNSTHKFVTVQEKQAWNNKSDFSGSYNDLSDKPAIPAAQVNADWNADSGVAQILNKPAIPDTSDCIKKSSTAGLVKNDGTIDTNTYLTQDDISGKANKSEMSVTDGTGADSDKTTIQLKNGTSATVLKNHQSLSGKQDVIDAQHKLSADLVDDTNSTNKFTNATEKQTWNSKQDAINDLATIRSGSSAGATAYQKPQGGIPDTDLSSAVQTSLSKADTALQQHQDISGKEDATTIIAPVNATDAELPITALSCEVCKYYRVDVAVDTLAVTLPAMTDLTTVRTVVVYLTAGTTPAVTITSADSKNVYYQDGFGIESGNTYEINALFNGDAWIVASVKINTSNS